MKLAKSSILLLGTILHSLILGGFQMSGFILHTMVHLQEVQNTELSRLL